MCKGPKSHCCGSCDHEVQMFDPKGDWANWDGNVEVQQTWVDWAAGGEVNHVTEDAPAPEGADTNWSVYGRRKDGSAFHIADFEFGDHDSAMKMAVGLEQTGKRIKEQSAEIARLEECLENPVGYINQHDLEILRSTGEVGDVTICTQASGYHNAAIYAQD